MYNAPSLTRAEWQAAVSDDDLRKVISEGRGRMPPTKLSRPMLDGMVRLVRSLSRQQPAAGADMPPGHPPIGGPERPPPASPSASATPEPVAPPSSAPKPGTAGSAIPSPR